MKAKISYLLLLAIGTLILSSCAGEQEKEKLASGPAYNFEQQVFCLNALSNISSHFNGNDESKILSLTTSAIDSVLSDDSVQNYIGHWKRVWGPLLKAYDQKATNTMYIAQSLDSPGIYVVAIAGTDASSKADWLKYDFNVYKRSVWPYVNPQNTKMLISDGTNDGLTNLVTLQGYNTDTKSQSTAEAFLKSRAGQLQSGKQMNIWVTGHSLGGALSPVYALYLDYERTNDKWSNANNVIVHCIAVAGATPGNDVFSNYYDNVLGSRTIRVWNTLDEVPHGFEINMLKQMPTLYQDASIYMDKDDSISLQGVIGTLALGNYKYTQLLPDTPGFTSNFYSSANMRPNAQVNPDTFFGQVISQHIPAYANYYQIDSFQYKVMRRLNLDQPFFSEGMNPAGIKNQ